VLPGDDKNNERSIGDNNSNINDKNTASSSSILRLQLPDALRPKPSLREAQFRDAIVRFGGVGSPVPPCPSSTTASQPGIFLTILTRFRASAFSDTSFFTFFRGQDAGARDQQSNRGAAQTAARDGRGTGRRFGKRND
jgi:hypothetical protein